MRSQTCEELAVHILRRFHRSVNQLIRRDLLSGFSEALLTCEEGFFTEWKLGNTPNEKSRNPAFGGVFFCLIASIKAETHDCIVS